MFGYLSASSLLLGEEQAARYKGCYCGLCHTLKERHGQLSRLTLNYDLCFLVLLLGSLYEPKEKESEGRCPVHPIKSQKRWQTEMSDYAADMTVMLSYLKCLDNWHDDGSLLSLAEAAALKSSYGELAAHYPRQHKAMTEALGELSSLEKERIEDADAASRCFGRFMAELMVYKEDRWSDTLRSLGDALGRFIYVMDAVIDLDKDAISGSYNPFRRYYGLNNVERFQDILKLLLSDCVARFDILPLVLDADILKNILCIGLWQQFEKKFKVPKGNTDVSGPVQDPGRLA